MKAIRSHVKRVYFLVWRVVLVAILVTILGFLSSCQPQQVEEAPTAEPTTVEPATVEPKVTETPPPAEESVSFPEPEGYDCDPLSDPAEPAAAGVTLQPEQRLIPGQLLLTGTEESIQELLQALGEREPELQLEQLSSFDFRFLADYPSQEQRQEVGEEPPASGAAVSIGRLPWSPAEVRFELYGYDPDQYTLSQLLQEVLGIQRDREEPLDVTVEPNYVIGYEITGDPWGVEGSPWGVEGSPWGVEGSPGSAEPTKAASLFWQQWALQEAPGIGLFTDADKAPDGRTINAEGAGVRVAIFDTSPFDAPGGYQFAGWGPEPDLRLCVYHPFALPRSDAAEKAGTIADHGLFVAGLAYAVARESELQLIRVLNEHGQGSVYDFIAALKQYTATIVGQQGDLQDTVINLSLGIQPPDEGELSADDREMLSQIAQDAGYLPLAPDRLPLVALGTTMVSVHELGAVVVAAAGNDSAGVSPPLPSQLPAAYPMVIGVEASNQRPARACFSNEGDVAAPGGEGGELPTVCEPQLSQCAKEGSSCPYGLISYAYESHKGYAYWVGTSFATPLVSGMAALSLDAGSGPSPAAVQTGVDCAAASYVVDASTLLSAACQP